MEAHDMPKKNILGLHARMEGLQYLERQILGLSPECRFDKASSSEEGRRLILRNTYDLIVADILKIIASEGDERRTPDPPWGHVAGTLLSALTPRRIGKQYDLDTGNMIDY